MFGQNFFWGYIATCVHSSPVPLSVYLAEWLPDLSAKSIAVDTMSMGRILVTG